MPYENRSNRVRTADSLQSRGCPPDLEGIDTPPHRILEVESVNKLADALERIGQGGVRAVIMDIEMPEGFASFEKLLSAAPHVPIMILSGSETECIARQAVEQGAQDYVLKNQLEEFRLGRVVRRMIELKAKEEAAILRHLLVGY